MTENRDLVSIVVPAFNAEKTIEATLRSVRSQSHENLEVVVVDDGSSDRTAEIALHHVAEDRRIQVISIPNGGVSNARNVGIAATKGPYVALIDADDLWHRDKIALQIRAIEEGGEEIGYVYCLSRRIDGQDRVLRNVESRLLEGNIYLRSLVFNPVGNGSSILARRAALEEAGCFNPARELQGTEDNLVQIFMNRTWAVRAVPYYLTGYRQSASSLSASFDRMSRARLAVLTHVKKRFPETPASVLAAAEARHRAHIAVQSFFRFDPGRAGAEFVHACRLAPICGLEVAAVDFLKKLNNTLKFSFKLSPGEFRLQPDFFECDPASAADPAPSYPLGRLLAKLAEAEDSFRRSVSPSTGRRSSAGGVEPWRATLGHEGPMSGAEV